MNERRCLACHAILTGDADCPVCGNPDYIISNNNPETLKKIQGWADDYRAGKLNAVEIAIHAYTYEMRNDRLEEKSVETVPICDAKALTFDEILWNNQKFARIDSDRQMNLTVVILKGGREIKKQDVVFKAPLLNDFWQIGAYLTEGLGVGFAIGNNESYVKTASISLI